MNAAQMVLGNAQGLMRIRYAEIMTLTLASSGVVQQIVPQGKLARMGSVCNLALLLLVHPLVSSVVHGRMDAVETSIVEVALLDRPVMQTGSAYV